MLVWIDLLQFELARGPLKISLEWEGLPFQFQTLLNCCFQYFPFLNLLWRPVNCKCIDNTNYIVFHARIVRWIFRPSVVFVISEFSLIWTTDYCIWSLFSILKFYTCDTFVISTKRCEKPSDNTSTVDRDAWYYMWGRFRISAAYQLILTFVKFRNQIKPWLGQCFSILTSGDDCIAGGSIYFRNKTCSFLVKHLGVWGLRWIHRIVT